MSNPSRTTGLTIRDRVLESAELLFSADSLMGVTTDSVAAGANIAIEQLTSEFATKNDLIEVVLDIRHNQWMTRLTTALDDFHAPEDKLLAIFTFLEHWFSEETFHRCAFITSYGELGPSTGWVDLMVRRHKNVFDTLVITLAEQAGLPRTVASSIALLADGAQVTAAATGSIAAARDARLTAALLIALYRGEPRDNAFL